MKKMYTVLCCVNSWFRWPYPKDLKCLMTGSVPRSYQLSRSVKTVQCILYCRYNSASLGDFRMGNSDRRMFYSRVWWTVSRPLCSCWSCYLCSTQTPNSKKIQINRIVQSKCNINDTFPMYSFLFFFFGCTCYCLVICFTFKIVCKLSSSYTHYFLYMYIQMYENEDCGKCN